MYQEGPSSPPLTLPVSGGHQLHVHLGGHPAGIPVVVLHGGPGSGASPLLRRFLDPRRYRIVCPDQRGAGLSTPRGALAHNTLRDLLDDLRRLQAHLALDRWVVVGGSWGATLAVAHALDAPGAVAGLLLRSIFLARDEDVDFFLQRPAGEPPIDGRGFHRMPAPEQQRLVLAWWHHEAVRAGAEPPADPPSRIDLQARVDRYRIQSHYMAHRFWLDDPPLLERLGDLPRVPTLLLHGRADRVCRPEWAQAFVDRCPHARLQWIDGAGHDPAHPAMAAAMVAALDAYARDGDFTGAAPAARNRQEAP